MAGRGTDIKLGGNKDYFKENKNISDKEFEDEEKVKKLGGLFIIEQSDTKVEELTIN